MSDPPGVRNEKSLKLFSTYSANELEQLLELSAGVRCAAATDSDISYLEGAMVPEQPWRAMGREEISSFFELDAEWEQFRSIAILAPSERIRNIIDVEFLATRPRQSISNEYLDGLAGRIVDAIQEDCDFSDNWEFNCLAINEPNMLTVSKNSSAELVGLHVDSWEASPLQARRFSKNRISLNLGPHSRYLLLIPLILDDMAELVARKVGHSVDLPTLPYAYMHYFSTFPVVRCVLPPGASYIVPTENVIHDGSTAGAVLENRQLVFRGNLQPLNTALV
jgi:hypothetical protein